MNAAIPERRPATEEISGVIERVTGNMAIAGTLPRSDQGELQGVAIFRVRSRLPG
jgi:hypothetical protein